jgi:ATP-dependent Clp protease ATP-binding subunit ClpA
VFERFTPQAKQAVTRAQDEAIDLGHDYIGTQHLLLGLAGVPGGLAAVVLTESGVTADRARAAVTSLPAPATGTSPAEALAAIGIDVDEIRRRADASFGSGRFVFPRPAFTPRAKEALTRSLSAAETLGDEDIDTQHLLLGLLTEAEGAAGDEDRAATALRALGAEPARLRAQLLDRAAAAS